MIASWSARKGEVVGPRQLDERCTRDETGQQASLLDGHVSIVDPMQDERRNANRRQDRTDVELAIHSTQGDDGTRAGRRPLHALHPCQPLGVIGDRRAVDLEHPLGCLASPLAPYAAGHVAIRLLGAPLRDMHRTRTG